MPEFDPAGLSAMADAYETWVGPAPKLRMYGSPTGAVKPALPATARTGTMLVEVAMATDWLTAAAAGVKTLIGAPSANAAAAGLMSYYTLVDTAGTSPKSQGLISMPWAQGAVVTPGYQMHVGANVYRCITGGTTAAAGTGPATNGSGINDNGVVWDWVGSVGISVANVNVAASQPVSVSGWTFTVPQGAA